MYPSLFQKFQVAPPRYSSAIPNEQQSAISVLCGIEEELSEPEMPANELVKSLQPPKESRSQRMQMHPPLTAAIPRNLRDSPAPPPPPPPPPPPHHQWSTESESTLPEVTFDGMHVTPSAFALPLSGNNAKTRVPPSLDSYLSTVKHHNVPKGGTTAAERFQNRLPAHNSDLELSQANSLPYGMMGNGSIPIRGGLGAGRGGGGMIFPDQNEFRYPPLSSRATSHSHTAALEAQQYMHSAISSSSRPSTAGSDVGPIQTGPSSSIDDEEEDYDEDDEDDDVDGKPAKRRCGRKSMNYSTEQKRERNRAAVKKCRQRQALKYDYLQRKANVLETENQHLSELLLKRAELSSEERQDLTRGIQMDILLKIKEIFTQSLPKDFVIDAESIWDLNSVLAVSMPSRCYYGIESIKDFWRTSLRMRNKGKIRSFWAWLFRLPPGERFTDFTIEPFAPSSPLYFINWTTNSNPPLSGSMVIMFGHGHRVTLHVECFGWLIWRYLLTNESFPEPPMD